jgi:hypothetical protein
MCTAGQRRRANRRFAARLTVMSFYARRGSTASSGLISSRQSFASQRFAMSCRWSQTSAALLRRHAR